jgi:nicotinamidase/pyrazinamidase
MKALIVVDIQNDFCPGGALAVRDGDQVVAIANQLMAKFDLVVATQDWHPKNHGSFAANHAGKKPYDMSELFGLPQVLWPVHCVQGSPGAAFHPQLEVKRLTKIFPKGTDPTVDSYSGFFDNGRRQATGLDEYLKARTINEVSVLGLATDYCVKYTALDAAELGFKTSLVVDGCRGVELQAGDVDKAIAEMRQHGVVMATSAET